MKCVYCGDELKEGALFCSKCGKPVQVVTEYSDYEDDYLKQVMKEANRSSGTSRQRNASPSGQEPSGGPNRQTYLFLAIGVAVIAVVAIVVVAFLWVRNMRQGSFDYQIEMAEEAYAKGDMEKAVAYYEKALWLDEDSVKIRLMLAKIHRETGDYNSMVLLCREILQKDAANREACAMLVSYYEEQKNYEAVLALYGQVDTSLADLFYAYVVTPPVFSREGGTYTQFMSVELATGGKYTIYYTTDGSDPTLHGKEYTGPIELDKNLETYKICAVCKNDKGLFSEIATKEFTIDIPAPAMPVVTPGGGNFSEPTTVTVVVPEGCKAYFTWDSTDPTAESEEYTGPLTVPEGNNILSVILVNETTELTSDIFRGNYVYYQTAPPTEGGDADDSSQQAGRDAEDEPQQAGGENEPVE